MNKKPDAFYKNHLLESSQFYFDKGIIRIQRSTFDVHTHTSPYLGLLTLRATLPGISGLESARRLVLETNSARRFQPFAV